MKKQQVPQMLHFFMGRKIHSQELKKQFSIYKAVTLLLTLALWVIRGPQFLEVFWNTSRALVKLGFSGEWLTFFNCLFSFSPLYFKQSIESDSGL